MMCFDCCLISLGIYQVVHSGKRVIELQRVTTAAHGGVGFAAAGTADNLGDLSDYIAGFDAALYGVLPQTH